jgi:5-methyltetrahydrofolate--homocysteine methyltransferase
MIRERVLRLDGATGTELAKQGMPPGVCPEKWVTENPQALCAVQGAYVSAGSNIVYAPTFGANPFKLAEFGLEDKCREMNAALVGISRNAVAGKALVFGDIAPTGQLIEPFGELPFEECVSAYKIQVAGLLEGGADGFAIETMMDLQECRAALLAVRELAPDHPVIVTMTFDETKITDVQVDVSAETPEIGGIHGETLRAQLLEKQSADIDGVTGATFTSDAMRQNIERAIEYYQKHKLTSGF